MKKKQVKKPSKKLKSSPVWSEKNKRLIGLLFFVFGFLLYANTLNHDYTLDDFSVIKENYITKQGIQGIPTAWKEHYRFGYWNATASLYRPLTLTTFNLDWAIAPDSPAFSHFVNVILYALTGIVLFLSLVKVLRKYNPWVPVLITGLFMAHPLHVECVANIKGRDEILAFLFLFSSVFAYWKYLDKKGLIWMVLTVLTFACSLVSKESAITFIAIFPLMLYFFREEPLTKTAPAIGFLFIPILAFLWTRYKVIGSMGVGAPPDVLDNALMAASNGASHFASAVSILGIYLFKMILPIELVHEKGFTEYIPIGLGNWKFVLSFLIYSGLGVYSVLQLKKKNLASFGILFFLLSISILCNVFVTIGVHYAERLLYYPLLGFCIAAVFGLFALGKAPLFTSGNLKTTFAQSKIPVLIAGGFILFFSVVTILRNPAWKDSYTLYKTDIKKSPNSAKLNYHYGLELVKKGVDDRTAEDKEYLNQAKQQFEKALKIRPSYGDAHGQLGLSYYRLKQKNKAIASYEKSISYKPNNAKVYSNMGIIYFEAQQLDKAEEVYRKSVSIDPRFVDARRNLGSVLAMKGKFSEAIEQFKLGVKYAPEEAILHFYLGQATKDSGNAEGAKLHFERAYQLDPSLKK